MPHAAPALSPAPAFHLEQIELQNYRCFAQATLTLHPQLTVLVAPNGGGKTALLDALAFALRSFVDTLAESKKTSQTARSTS